MILRKFKYFYPEQPRLLVRGQRLFDELSENPLWVAEPKYNGQRVEIHLIDGEASFWGRHGEPLKYKATDEVKEALKMFPQVGYYLLDGELRHGKTKNVRDKIVLWDVFIHNNKLLLTKPYWARRSLLLDLGLKLNDLEIISLIQQYTKDFGKVFKRLIAFEEFEGLVLKNTQGLLNLGAKSCPNSKWMFKVRKETGRHRY
jgi:ATP-dependent DNA ligase